MQTPPRTYKQLQPEDRVILSSLKQRNYSIRAIARELGRTASTISRELSRNTVDEHYGSVVAQRTS